MIYILKISLRAARVNAELKQKEAGEKIGVSLVTVLNWEKGKTVPNARQLEKICEVYGCCMDDLRF